MPPVAKAGGSAFRKDVRFAETKDSDEFELEATGIVMVPDKADLQNDFARPDTIRSFAEQFGTFAEAGQAGGGIMHAVWPDGWMELTRNEVLDEPADIGGETVDAGAWVQTWGIDNPDLATLIDDNILEGYSIGAIEVDWQGPFEQDETDVDTSEIPDGEMVWELTDGIVREVSAVDIPAVPDAEILTAKDVDKRLADHVGNRDAFIEEALERGHSEADAERLWNVLTDAMEADGAGDPGKQSRLRDAANAFLSALTGGGSDDTAARSADTTRADVLRTFPDDAPIPDDIEEFDECVDWAMENIDVEDEEEAEEYCGEYWQPENAKAGRTLSQANRDSAMAAVDANLELLQDAGVDVPTRFTDREDVDFDLSEHEARSFDDDEGDGGPFSLAADTDESADKDAPDGDTSDGDTTDMSDDNGGDKSLAEKNAEQINELSDAVKSLAEAMDGGGDPPDADKTAEVELPDGTVAEISKAEAMAWFEDGDGDGGDPATKSGDPPATKEDIEALHQRLDSITRQSGHSQQLSDNGDDDPDSGLDALGKALN